MDVTEKLVPLRTPRLPQGYCEHTNKLTLPDPTARLTFKILGGNSSGHGKETTPHPASDISYWESCPWRNLLNKLWSHVGRLKQQYASLSIAWSTENSVNRSSVKRQSTMAGFTIIRLNITNSYFHSSNRTNGTIREGHGYIITTWVDRTKFIKS